MGKVKVLGIKVKDLSIVGITSIELSRSSLKTFSNPRGREKRYEPTNAIPMSRYTEITSIATTKRS
jgi:hypothetical protein